MARPTQPTLNPWSSPPALPSFEEATTRFARLLNRANQEQKNGTGVSARVSIGIEFMELAPILLQVGKHDDPAMELLLSFAEQGALQHELEKLRTDLENTKDAYQRVWKLMTADQREEFVKGSRK
jgi:hypothetical protein